MTEQGREIINKMVAEPERESSAGYHFISYYIENPYGWYLRYIRGYRPKFTKAPLIMGSALHHGCEITYQTWDKTDTLSAFGETMKSRQHEYEDPEQYKKDLEDGRLMLTKWYDTWAEHDRANFNVLHVEDKFAVPLPNGYFMTVKPDLIVELKEAGHPILCLDHKSSRWSMGKAHDYLAGSDQPTSYIWALSQLYPGRKILGVQSDVLYKNRSKVDAQRVGIVQRDAREIAEFQLEMIGALSEIAQKVKGLAAGWPAHLLFPRNGKDESFFGSEWPYIYRSALPEDPTEAPFGYVIDEWTKSYVNKVVEMVDDNPTSFDINATATPEEIINENE